jgi:hypothetical protein
MHYVTRVRGILRKWYFDFYTFELPTFRPNIFLIRIFDRASIKMMQSKSSGLLQHLWNYKIVSRLKIRKVIVVNMNFNMPEIWALYAITSVYFQCPKNLYKTVNIVKMHNASVCRWEKLSKKLQIQFKFFSVLTNILQR